MSSDRAAASLPAPVSGRQAWSRLGLFVGALAAAFALVALVVVWLVPPDLPSRTATYPLADLEVGVPALYRPFNMGGKAGRLDGVWLVRREDGSVRAFWSRPAHPAACAVEPTPVTVSPPPLPRGVTPTPSARPGFPATETVVLGFREPCLSSNFLLDGTRNFGPSPRGLDSFATHVEGQTVSIDVGRFILGPCDPMQIHSGCSTPNHVRTQHASWPRPSQDLR